MLVLTRKAGETIRIGDEVAITVVKIKGGDVRIGIEAPQAMRITRSELPPLSTDAESEGCDEP